MKPFYEDEAATLYLGDYRDVLPEIESADHAIFDPPYSEHVHASVRSAKMLANDRGGKYGSDTRRNVDLGFEHLADRDRDFLAAHIARIVSRWTLVFSDAESSHLWRESLEAVGLDYVRTGAWVKVGSTPQFSGDRPATGFEAVTIAHPKGRKRWNGGGKHAVWSVPIVLKRSRLQERNHPTEKPLSLMRALVEEFTDPGEVILDMTAGSGTTGIAAKETGRRAVLIERDEKHAETAARRLSECQPLDLGALA